MALSDVKIRTAKASDKPRRLWDGGGLYLEISPSGAKLSRLKYRYQGKEKLLALASLALMPSNPALSGLQWITLIRSSSPASAMNSRYLNENGHPYFKYAFGVNGFRIMYFSPTRRRPASDA
jgi:hypothetical protein